MRTYALSEPVNGHHTWHDGKRYAWLLGLLVTSILMTWRWHRRERLGLVIDRV